MAATTPLVPIRARRPAVALSASQHLAHTREASDDLLPQTTEDDLATRTATLNLYALGSRRE
jgi:hypothetical protein